MYRKPNERRRDMFTPKEEKLVPLLGCLILILIGSLAWMGLTKVLIWALKLTNII